MTEAEQASGATASRPVALPEPFSDEVGGENGNTTLTMSLWLITGRGMTNWSGWNCAWPGAPKRLPNVSPKSRKEVLMPQVRRWDCDASHQAERRDIRRNCSSERRRKRKAGPTWRTIYVQLRRGRIPILEEGARPKCLRSPARWPSDRIWREAKTPEDLDAAVTATMEVESYLVPRTTSLSQ